MIACFTSSWYVLPADYWLECTSTKVVQRLCPTQGVLFTFKTVYVCLSSSMNDFLSDYIAKGSLKIH